ncbi:MAG: hypothetical protein EHM49_01060 [Deltaproteobacteria bacterium]|nr:MAG: hypothetical protein EHM49_01060 [Deltaproteobacteria bacterium]
MSGISDLQKLLEQKRMDAGYSVVQKPCQSLRTNQTHPLTEIERAQFELDKKRYELGYNQKPKRLERVTESVSVPKESVSTPKNSVNAPAIPEPSPRKAGIKVERDGEFLTWINMYHPDKRHVYLPPVITTRKKELYPLLVDVRSRPSWRLIFADFDKLPERYGSWQELICDLQIDYELTGKGRIITTPSGKAKVAFVISGKTKPVDALLQILKPEHHGFDKSPVAITRCFVVNPEELKDINSLSLFSFEEEEKQKVTTLVNIPSLSYSSPQEIKGKLLEFIGESEKKEQFLRLLMASWSLIGDKGFGISQIYFAKLLGTSWQTIGRWLYELQRLGMLRTIDGYIVGKKAKHYAATGLLRKTIADHKKKKHRSVRRTEDFERMVIRDGEWNYNIYYIRLRCGLSAEGFKKLCMRLPGIHLKDRIRKVDAANRSFYKYQEAA